MRISRRRIIILALFLLGAIIFTPAIWLWVEFDRAVSETTDLKRFNSIRARLADPSGLSPGANGALKIFPTSIPNGDATARLFFRPHYLQGGTMLQLRLSLPADQVEAIRVRYEPLAIQTTDGCADAISEINKPGGVMMTAFRNASNTNFEALPVDFKVYTLSAHPGPAISLPWENGYAYGVAVSQARNEVVYWVDDE